MAFKTNLMNDPIKPDEYDAEVFSTREITTKSGYPMVWVDWRITAGPNTGGLVSQGIAFVPQMVDRNNHLLKAMGLPYGKAEVEIEHETWIGIVCRIVVKHRDGKAEVDDLKPVAAGEVRRASVVEPMPVDPDEPPF